MYKTLLATLGLLFSTALWSFNCYFTAVKDTCWAKYDVTIIATDALTSKPILTASLPKNIPWVRQEFVCHPKQKMMYSVTFTPNIWDKDQGKVYLATNIWNLPDQIKPGETAWNVSICFPNSFSGVPMPREATANCKCDFTSIPAPAPKEGVSAK